MASSPSAYRLQVTFFAREKKKNKDEEEEGKKKKKKKSQGRWVVDEDGCGWVPNTQNTAAAAALAGAFSCRGAHADTRDSTSSSKTQRMRGR